MRPTPESEKWWARKYLAEASYWRLKGNRGEAAKCLAWAVGCTSVARHLAQISATTA